MKKNIEFAGCNCDVKVTRYYNDNTRLALYDKDDGMPVATASVNTAEKLLYGEVIIKDYSENTGIYQVLVDNNIIHPAHRHQEIGMESCPVSFINTGRISF